MMRNKIILVVVLMANMAFARSYRTSSQNIVCYVNSEIKTGVNEISLVADSFDLFPTMDMVVDFIPPTGVLGDDLIFNLDGRRRCYRFDSWDGTNYVLTTTAQWQPLKIGLDWIPLRERFWINHVSTNAVQVMNSGEVSDAYMRKMSLVPSTPKRNVEIHLISDDNEKSRILFGK